MCTSFFFIFILFLELFSCLLAQLSIIFLSGCLPLFLFFFSVSLSFFLSTILSSPHSLKLSLFKFVRSLTPTLLFKLSLFLCFSSSFFLVSCVSFFRLFSLLFCDYTIGMAIEDITQFYLLFPSFTLSPVSESASNASAQCCAASRVFITYPTNHVDI